MSVILANSYELLWQTCCRPDALPHTEPCTRWVKKWHPFQLCQYSAI